MLEQLHAVDVFGARCMTFARLGLCEGYTVMPMIFGQREAALCRGVGQAN